MLPVYNLSKSKHPDVKLSQGCVVPEWTSYQDGVVDVFLNDPLFSGFLLQKTVNFFNWGKNSDAATSVGIFSWLNDPDSFGLMGDVEDFFVLSHVRLCSYIVSLRHKFKRISFCIISVVFWHSAKKVSFIRDEIITI